MTALQVGAGRAGPAQWLGRMYNVSRRRAMPSSLRHGGGPPYAGNLVRAYGCFVSTTCVAFAVGTWLEQR
jgi:hypothetical protein